MMKKKLAVLVLALCVAGAVLSGCGQTEAGESGRQPENQTEIQAPASQPEQEENSAESPAEGGAETSKEANVFTDWLPAGVEQVMAETEANPELEQAIIDYYEIPEESWGTTKYYYNYVDLNGDGKEEILAVVMGPYTSGSGGIYKGVGDGEVLDSLDGVEGTAIICNDLIADMENGDYLTLEKVSSAS